MKKRTYNKKPSNRIPPSVPKCVKKCADGYTTEYIKQPDTNETIRFIFKKTQFGYSVLQNIIGLSEKIDMGKDIRFSPTTRHMFSNLITLKDAIATTEKWLGCSLPEIR